jgi:hypothetical protein
MTKNQAIKHLGGTKQSVARAIGISVQAVHKWPPILTDRIRDRVEAAIARKNAK